VYRVHCKVYLCVTVFIQMNLFQLLTPDKVLIPERYLELEDSAPLSPEEEQEKQRKLERIKTLIAKSKWVSELLSRRDEGLPIASLLYSTC